MPYAWLLLYTGDQWTQSTANTDAGSSGYHGIKLLPAMLNLFFDVVQKLSEGWSRLAEKDSPCRGESIGRQLRILQSAACGFRVRYLLFHNVLDTPRLITNGGGWRRARCEIRIRSSRPLVSPSYL